MHYISNYIKISFVCNGIKPAQRPISIRNRPMLANAQPNAAPFFPWFHLCACRAMKQPASRPGMARFSRRNGPFQRGGRPALQPADNQAIDRDGMHSCL